MTSSFLSICSTCFFNWAISKDIRSSLARPEPIPTSWAVSRMAALVKTNTLVWIKLVFDCRQVLFCFVILRCDLLQHSHRGIDPFAHLIHSEGPSQIVLTHTCLLVWFSVALNNLKTLYWIWYVFSTSFRGKRLLIRWQTVSEWQGIIMHCDKITEKNENERKLKLGYSPTFQMSRD